MKGNGQFFPFVENKSTDKIVLVDLQCNKRKTIEETTFTPVYHYFKCTLRVFWHCSMRWGGGMNWTTNRLSYYHRIFQFRSSLFRSLLLILFSFLRPYILNYFYYHHQPFLLMRFHDNYSPAEWYNDEWWLNEKHFLLIGIAFHPQSIISVYLFFLHLSPSRSYLAPTSTADLCANHLSVIRRGSVLGKLI